MRKLLCSMLSVLILLSFTIKTQAATPLYGYRWDTNNIILDKNSSPVYGSEWYNATNIWNSKVNPIVTTGSNSSFKAYETFSNETWDGMSMTSTSGGRILSSSIYVNTRYFSISKYTFSIRQGIMIHEIGHSLGLDHNDGDLPVGSVMFSYTFNSNGTLARTNNEPTIPDVQAVNTLYPPSYLYTNTITDNETTIILNPSWSIKYDSIHSIAKDSTLIVEGIVETDNTYNVPKKGDYMHYSTHSKINIKKVLKGDESLKNKSIILSQIGGKDDTVTVKSTNTTYMEKNQKVILFLLNTPEGYYIPINQNDGVYVKNNSGHYINLSSKESKTLTDIEIEINGGN